MSFSTFDLHPSLRRGIDDLGFTEPTPIQLAALPPALAGRDVLGCAMTGSGKTAAFVLPILQRIGGLPGGTTRALVLAPTRELAGQIHEHLVALARHTQIRSATVFGGVKPGPQERALRAGVDVVIATPGRLLDLMRQPWVRFDALEVLVLDEADRMLDMGFLPDVRRILSRLPERRQTLFFSATLPRPIVALSREMLHDPVRLDVERKQAPASGIEQTVMPVPHDLKHHLLLEMIRRQELSTALVFTRTKHRANRLARFLDQAGVSCDRIHGNRSQKQRESALGAFKRGQLQILVATDIAARGIDVEALPHVVNFDVPGQAEDYIHRVGRTARAQLTGAAITFASPQERGELAGIERALGRPIARRSLEGFDYRAESGGRFEIPISERLAAHRAGRSGRGHRKPDTSRNGAPSRGRNPAPRPSRPVPVSAKSATTSRADSSTEGTRSSSTQPSRPQTRNARPRRSLRF